MLTSSVEDRRARAAYLVDELLGAYARAVDDQDFTAWLALFATECAYEVRAMENVREGLPLAYMMDDCRERLADRVKMIQEVWAGTVEPYDTRHFQQRTAMRELGEDRWEVRSNVLVTYTGAPASRGFWSAATAKTSSSLTMKPRCFSRNSWWWTTLRRAIWCTPFDSSTEGVD